MHLIDKFKRKEIKENKEKKITLILVLGFTLAAFLSSVIDFSSDLKEIRDNTLRIHILANSNDTFDQELKLSVRDEVLLACNNILQNSENKGESEEILIRNLEELKAVAKETITVNGYDYSVDCTLSYVDFPEKTYGNITLPRGNYEALQIIIGEGEGENWWCMIYPQLCVATALSEENTEYYDNSQIKIITQPEEFEIKFKILEIFNRLFNF